MSEQLKAEQETTAPVDESGATGQPAGEAGAGASEGDRIESLRHEKDALQDRLLRTAAEFDNYRKRIDRERRELAEYAAADALTEMLPIIDNLERALQAPAAGDEAFRKGVELIHK